MGVGETRIRKYRVTYLEYALEGHGYTRKDIEFRALRQAAEFCIKIEDDPRLTFDRMVAVEYTHLTNHEVEVFEFMTDGKIKLRTRK